MNVLIVKDDPLVAGALNRLLAGQGHSMFELDDRALPMMVGKGERYDAIVLNRTIVELGRFDVVGAIRSAGCDAPVIVLDHSDHDDELSGIDVVDGFAWPPSFKVGELLGHLRPLGGRMFVFEVASAA